MDKFSAEGTHLPLLSALKEHISDLSLMPVYRVPVIMWYVWQAASGVADVWQVDIICVAS